MNLKFSSSYLIPKAQMLNNQKISLSSPENAGAANPLLRHISYPHKRSLVCELRKDNLDLPYDLENCYYPKIHRGEQTHESVFPKQTGFA